MKKFRLGLLLFVLPILCTAFVLPKAKRGGDVFEIYLNGKRVHQQFVHADKSTKAIRLASFGNNDRIEVLYSHCGQSGKSRVLTLRNDKNEVLKELKFADATGNRSLMGFSRKDLGKTTPDKLRLYYRSSELPDGKLLAVIGWDGAPSLAKR